MNRLSEFLVYPSETVTRVLEVIEGNHRGIALVVQQDRQLEGTITDGDVRRLILDGISTDVTAEDVLARKPGYRPITALHGTPEDELIRLMIRSDFRHIPILDEAGRAVDIALLSDLVKDIALPMNAVVMAGGYGKRLRPLTQDTPKPMLPVGDRPLLEHVIDQLKIAGVRHVNLATHYRGDVISDHFGDGRNFGVEIDYLKEEEPLGTAGALSLLAESDDPLLVINGDILTEVDFRSFLDFHREHRADMTVGVREYAINVPYGVVETSGEGVTGISEKPVIRHFVNAGIYLLDKSARAFIPERERFDMTELIQALVDSSRRVVSFPILEYWSDIGQMEDYEQAQRHAEDTKLRGIA
jgi:dTDP-glucose pyrophosphorylase